MRLATVLLALGAASTTVYFVAGWGWTYVAVGVLTTAAIALCARSTGWYLIAASNGLATAGDLAYYAYSHGYPSAADLLYLFSYALLIPAVIVFSRRAGGDALSGRLLMHDSVVPHR